MQAMQKAAAVLVLLLAATCQAQVRGPAHTQEITIPIGRLAPITHTLEADESEYSVLGDGMDAMREYDPDVKVLRLRLLGYAPGVAYVVISSTKGGKLQKLHVIKVTIGTGPLPPPVPPGPGPGPDPKPDPIVAGKLYVVVIEETRQAVPERAVWFGDRKLEAAMKSKGHRWRIVDKDVQNSEGQTPADVKRFIEASAGKSLPMLFLVNEAGKTVYSGTVPKTGDELIALLTKFGG